MDRFTEMQTFCAVVEKGSFVAAAAHLNLSKAAVSRYLQGLEERLQVRLLQRTTRRMTLTEEGTLFYERARQLVDGVFAAEDMLQEKTEHVQGTLRINAPITYGVNHLAHLWPEFHRQYPQLKLEVTLSDRITDVVEEGFDLAIRISQLPQSTLIMRKLASTEIVMAASPKYLQQFGTPQQLSDLKDYPIAHYSYWSDGLHWRFQGPNGTESVAIQPWFVSNNGESCKAMALAHQGLILQPDFLLANELASGQLLRVLPQYKALQLGIYAVFPSRKQLAPKVRAVIDYLVAALA